MMVITKGVCLLFRCDARRNLIKRQKMHVCRLFVIILVHSYYIHKFMYTVHCGSENMYHQFDAEIKMII